VALSFVGHDPDPSPAHVKEHDMVEQLRPDTALIVIDVQAAFDHPRWGARNNPDADHNISGLVNAFGAADLPVVFVQHESSKPGSLFHPESPGHAFKDYLATATPDLVITKTVHSSFHGTPDLHTWLTAANVGSLVIAGITTNHCCETTARIAGDLGYDVVFALDATHTFDRTSPDGWRVTADELAGVTATNLHGEFATVVSTAQVIEGLGGIRADSRGSSR
jgi:nicotinamidase-related amidase